MSRGIADWENLGIWPLQDHDIDGVELGKRLQLVGCRMSFVPDPNKSTDPTQSIMEFAVESDKGTIGDIHPWLFWQTDDRDKRDTGSWAQAFAVRITGIAGGAVPIGPAGPQSVSYLPIRSSGFAEDNRYETKQANIPFGSPPPAVGDVCIVMPGTEETAQHEVLICGGGGAGGTSRLVCPTKEGPATMGTLVIDLQPFGELCMDNSPIPGIGGRHARLQSVFRVIPMDQGAAIGAGAGNSVAINHSLSPLDSLAGFGMTWCRLDGGGPITPSRGGAAREIQQARIDPGVPIGPPLPPGPIGPPLPPGRGGGGLSESGKFTPVKHPGHGIAYLAHLGAFGPLHGGSETDKHRIGLTRDGEVCNSSHLATQALWYQDATKDGPMHFELDPYPDPPDMSLTAKVHLVWDGAEPHAWLRGNRDGKWKWYCESPVISPETNGQFTGGTTGSTGVTQGGGVFTGDRGPTTGVRGGPGQGPGTFPPGRTNPSGPGGRGGGFFTGGTLPSAPRRRLDPPGLFPKTRRGNLPLFPGGGPGGKPQPQPRSVLPSKPITPGRFEFDKIWAGSNPLRPGNPDPFEPGGGNIGLPGSRQPGSTLHRPITPGGSRQPSQGLGWEHYMGRSAPRTPSSPSFPGSRAPSIGPGTGRGPNFGQVQARGAGLGGGGGLGGEGFPRGTGGSAPPGD